MPGTERIEVTSDITEAVGRFTAMRGLGKVATDLEKEVNSIHKLMDVLAPAGSLDAPEGTAFRFEAIGPEDPMHVEVRQTEYDTRVWARTWPADYERWGGPDTYGRTGRFYFDGARIEYDKYEHKVWVYNKEGWLRVLFDPGTSFKGIVPVSE